MSLFLVLFISLLTRAGSLEFEMSPMWLVNQALDASELVERQKTTLAGLDINEKKYLSRYHSKLKAKIYNNRNQLAVSNSFFPSDSSQMHASVGWEKQFDTGTKLSTEIYSNGNRENLLSFDGTSFSSSEQEYKEGRVTLGLRQSLNRNRFGQDDRRDLQALQTDQRALDMQSHQQIEDYAMFLVEAYYSAWIAFNSKPIAKDRMAREKKRNEIYRKQFDRGFVDETDILQLKSALLSARDQMDENEHTIRRTLVRLGNEIKQDLLTPYISGQFKIDLVDRPLDEIDKMCEADLEDSHSFTIEGMKAQKDGSQFRAESAAGRDRSDVYFEAQIISNGIDVNEGKSFEQVESFENAQYYFGLGWEMPLGDSEQTLNAREARLRVQDLELALSRERSSRKTEHLSDCLNFTNGRRKEKLLKQRIQLERDRVTQLDQKYEVGKVDLNSVVLTENALAQTQAELIVIQSQMFVDAWRIRRSAGLLGEVVKKYLKPQASNTEGDAS